MFFSRAHSAQPSPVARRAETALASARLTRDRSAKKMSDWTDNVFGKVIGRIYVQKKAHALTLLSVLWVIISLIAFLVCKGSSDLIGWLIASFVWTLHLAFILGAIWFWRHEKKDTEILIRETID
jgi:hypothetical protein